MDCNGIGNGSSNILCSNSNSYPPVATSLSPPAANSQGVASEKTASSGTSAGSTRYPAKIHYKLSRSSPTNTAGGGGGGSGCQTANNSPATSNVSSPIGSEQCSPLVSPSAAPLVHSLFTFW